MTWILFIYFLYLLLSLHPSAITVCSIVTSFYLPPRIGLNTHFVHEVLDRLHVKDCHDKRLLSTKNILLSEGVEQ